MVRVSHFIETCSNRYNDNGDKDCRIPFVVLTCDLFNWSFNRRFFVFSQRHLLVLALMSL